MIYGACYICMLTPKVSALAYYIYLFTELILTGNCFTTGFWLVKTKTEAKLKVPNVSNTAYCFFFKFLNHHEVQTSFITLVSVVWMLRWCHVFRSKQIKDQMGSEPS